MIFWDKFKDNFEPDEPEEKEKEEGAKAEEAVKSESKPAAQPAPQQASPPSGTAADSKAATDSATSVQTGAKVGRSSMQKEKVADVKTHDVDSKIYDAEVAALPAPDSEEAELSATALPKEAKKRAAMFKTWYNDSYESVVTQRNLLFLVAIICMVTIAMSVMVIRYVKNSQTMEPFVIEIEKTTGIPTVVDPVGVSVYSANEAVQRYFVMTYIRAREEYIPATFEYNFSTVVRVLSDPGIYFNEYRPSFSTSNPNSPYNLFRQHTSRTVLLRSYTPKTANTALVRVSFELSGASQGVRQDKVILIGFEFQNLEMNRDERLINPLGFRVTFYRIEDEQI